MNMEKVYFEVPAPGEYRFREVAAPEGYELNETIFSFTVFEDGSIIGDCTITNQKHYGTITASYETDRKGDRGFDGRNSAPCSKNRR